MSPKRICVVLATWTALWAALWACPTRSQADGITFDSAYAERLCRGPVRRHGLHPRR